MNDSYDNDYNEFSSPKVEVKMGVKEAPVQQAVQREVPPPSRKQEKKDLTAIAPPKPGELGPAPTVDIPKLQNTVNDTMQNIGAPVAPSFHSPIDIQGTLNNALQSPYLVPGLIGAGLAGAALHAHLSSKKEDKIKSTAERDIKRIDPDMNVSQTPATGRVEPTFNTNEVPQNADLNQILKVVGGQVDSRRDAEMVAKSENNRAMKAGQPVPFPQLQTPQETAKEIAPQSPITASTSPEESATIANLTEASKTPSEGIAPPSAANDASNKSVIDVNKNLLNKETQEGNQIADAVTQMKNSERFNKLEPKLANAQNTLKEFEELSNTNLPFHKLGENLQQNGYGIALSRENLNQHYQNLNDSINKLTIAQTPLEKTAALNKMETALGNIDDLKNHSNDIKADIQSLKEQGHIPSAEVKPIKGAVKPLLTGSGMPAVQGTAPPGTKFSKTVAGPHEIPSTHAFVPGGQLMDIVRNGVGQNEYLSSLKKSGGFPTTSQEAYQKVRDINESMSRLPRDVAKELGIGLGEPVKSITQKLPGGGKAITSGGIIGALVAMSDLANAGQSMKEKDPGMAWANLSQLLNAHPMGQVLQSIVSMSPEDLEASRRMIEREKHAKKVGGGRGLVNSGT